LLPHVLRAKLKPCLRSAQFFRAASKPLSFAGRAYTGHYAYPTDLASMEATYLVDLMSASGGYTAPLAEQGAISLAIWQIMFPTSTKTDGTYFPVDPAA
jgi:hypothetical protein